MAYLTNVPFVKRNQVKILLRITTIEFDKLFNIVNNQFNLGTYRLVRHHIFVLQFCRDFIKKKTLYNHLNIIHTKKNYY